MRIIGGTHRSRTILPPRDDITTRPITDRVKQSLFDRLVVRGRCDGGNALDIFAGTGSLGLEALSRGVDHCTFIERDRDARSRLEKNLESLEFTEQAAVLAVDALSAGWALRLPHRPLSLIFCDPPYRMTQDADDLARVCEVIRRLAELAEPDAVLALRTDDHTAPPPVDGWQGPETVEYGSMHVHLYTR